MNTWFLGKEIEYFKPLKSKLTLERMNELEIIEKDKNYSIEKLYSFGFLDPKYPNAIRFKNSLIILDKNKIIKEININEYNFKKYNYYYFKDYSKGNKIILSEEVEKIKGISIRWLLFDLENYARAIKEDSDYIYFQSNFFTYRFYKNQIKLKEIFLNKNDSKVIELEFNLECSKIVTKKDSFLFSDEYFKWLFCLVNSSKINYKKISTIKELLSLKWTVNPQIWNEFNISNKDSKQISDFFIKDISLNGIFKKISNKKILIQGWIFNYTWTGNILEKITLPSGEEITQLKIEGFSLTVDESKFSLEKIKPEKITDLKNGNHVNLLPESIIKGLKLDPHAGKRYNQRVCKGFENFEIIPFAKYDIYNYGIVVEGANKEDRRKVITNKYCYIIDSYEIISLWGLEKKIPSKIKIKESPQLRRLDKMTKLFEQIHEMEKKKT